LFYITIFFATAKMAQPVHKCLSQILKLPHLLYNKNTGD